MSKYTIIQSEAGNISGTIEKYSISQTLDSTLDQVEFLISEHNATPEGSDLTWEYLEGIYEPGSGYFIKDTGVYTYYVFPPKPEIYYIWDYVDLVWIVNPEYLEDIRTSKITELNGHLRTRSTSHPYYGLNTVNVDNILNAAVGILKYIEANSALPDGQWRYVTNEGVSFFETTDTTSTISYAEALISNLNARRALDLSNYWDHFLNIKNETDPEVLGSYNITTGWVS